MCSEETEFNKLSQPDIVYHEEVQVNYGYRLGNRDRAYATASGCKQMCNSSNL